MRLSDFDYNLPENLIATHPVSPRDHSRLLVLNKHSGAIEHRHFYDFVEYLQKGDVLVLNNSKVVPARLVGKKVTGGKVEVFLHQLQGDNWQCLIGGKGMKAGMLIEFGNKKELTGKVEGDNNDGTFEISFDKHGKNFWKAVEILGEVPIPPYIKKQREFLNLNDVQKNDEHNYQTVYADDDKKGSVAAPTAGLHFTPELLQKIKGKGVQIEYVTLHVGLGTFAPVKVDDIKGHKMHSEFVEIRKEVLRRIVEAKVEERRIISVGTTSARALEAYAYNQKNFKLLNNVHSGLVNIFIYPGYEFKIVDAMITNFHLPKSTLLMLISALAGTENIKKAYTEAIKENYRFYSYGDGMFIN
ncbi:tRNA preQ1(34) S-adenosylmethionine ribosyltransferase-isomerase QueA [Candidatus Parcubacteria bacterium]|nr:tRNA preQ1(34) S-adenosylmethionine ribosyltransferase-isomerase QueA [Patescibacteria group bacterium]MBU4309613.1 tRNA preQ1(34) S-adenosylmethionine ribosyltransferase-isomerase QueA [Patescibacteria group bacterium]MBU4432155.1 tRNA preQ1(34) S-adenosylmethionine ribosyltransferase-isomerase QueA [Patescibacteria group bacterium]MBU4577999.1 tRNA preQ1(34) S-adenosylmethionine ribosyltransferase-isomerase QueA [Patescibacteria group bacterium]MCG2696493.1 tRNA preQ1(34) S-adenosylmethion